ncbi:MAG TPA: hypothetical protein VFE84_05140, partial [Patescibacteria group bacterium]|nr:hypothetical protein [Patescibacteria group bacterium]
MIEAIQKFITELRAAGLRVSPSEAIDAARAAQAVGVEGRDAFRVALRSTLAKTRHDSTAFDRMFERFFAAPAPEGDGRRRDERGGPSAPGAGRAPRKARPEKPDEESPPAAASFRPVPGGEPRTRPGRLKLILSTVRPSGGGRPTPRRAGGEARQATLPATRRSAMPRPRTLPQAQP